MTDELLILEQDAAAYREAVEVLEIEDLAVSAITDPGDWSRATPALLLAQPDLARSLIERRGPPGWLQSTWAGVRPLIEPAARHGFVLTGVKGIFGPLIAEYVFAYVLERSRRLEPYRRAQAAREWSGVWPETLRDRCMSVVGTGSLGTHVARTAVHFRMRVLGVSAGGAPREPFAEVFALDSAAPAFAAADVVVACLPDTPETQGAIGRALIDAMPAHALFINVGRASTVDHAALVGALESGRLAGAVLDVLPEEPLPANDALWAVPNLTITPHVAAVSYPADVVGVFADNLARRRRGEALAGVVDPSRGY